MPRDRIFPVHAGVSSTAPRLRVGQSVWLGATDAVVHCSWTSAVVSEAVSALWPVDPVRAIPMPAGGRAVAQMLQAAELHVADCDVRPDPTVPPVEDRPDPQAGLAAAGMMTGRFHRPFPATPETPRCGSQARESLNHAFAVPVGQAGSPPPA